MFSRKPNWWSGINLISPRMNISLFRNNFAKSFPKIWRRLIGRYVEASSAGLTDFKMRIICATFQRDGPVLRIELYMLVILFNASTGSSFIMPAVIRSYQAPFLSLSIYRSKFWSHWFWKALFKAELLLFCSYFWQMRLKHCFAEVSIFSFALLVNEWSYFLIGATC